MSKDDKPDALPNASARRLEFHLESFMYVERTLTCAQAGELVRMLMVEAMGSTAATTDGQVKKAYDARNEYRRIAGSVRRAPLPLSLRKQVYERDGGVCRYCQEAVSWEKYQCDHVTPRSKGGADTIDNLAASCSRCNRDKSDKCDWVRI